MAVNSILDLVLEISANPTNAIAAIKEFQAQAKSASTEIAATNAAATQGAAEAAAATQGLASAQREVDATAQDEFGTVAQWAQMHGKSAEEAAQLYRQMGLSAQEAEAEIKAAFGGAAAAEEAAGAAGQAAGERMSGGILKSVSTLREFRVLMYSTLGIVSFGFYISEWERVVQVINDATSSLGGYSKAQRDLFAQQQKFNLQLVTSNPEVLKQNVQNAVAEVDKIRVAIKKVKDQIAATHETSADFMALTATAGASFRDEGSDISGLQQKLKDLQSQLEQANLDEQKANLELAQYQHAHEKAAKSVKAHAAELDKAALSEERWAEAIARARVELPPFISEIERLQKALLVPEARANNNLFAYAELNAERLQQKLAPLEASFKQLGIGFPSAQSFAIPPFDVGVVDGNLRDLKRLANGKYELITRTWQLTAAEQAALPTQRELQIVRQQLLRMYPQMSQSELAAAQAFLIGNENVRRLVDSTGTATTGMNAFSRSHMAARQSVQELDRAISSLLGTEKSGLSTLKDFADAILQQGRASQESAEMQTASNIQAIMQMILGQRLYAEVEAIVQTAEGFAALAELNFWSAAQHFTSAAMWALVAQQTPPKSGGSQVAAASSGTATGTAAGSGPSHALASGTASAQAAAKQGQQTVQVIIQGNVYGGRAGLNELISHIAGAVKYNRAYLPASHTVTGKRLG